MLSLHPCHFQGGVRHERNHPSEGVKALVLCLAEMVADVDLGDNDCESEEAKGMVKMDVMDGTAAFQRIAFHQLARPHDPLQC